MSAPVAPAFFANFVSRTASRVLFDPVPGITLMRPAAVSTTAAMMCSCSSWLSVGDSPVVPTGARQSVPCSTCQFTSFFNAVKSTSPPRKGVTSATVTPANCSPFVFAMNRPLSEAASRPTIPFVVALRFFTRPDKNGQHAAKYNVGGDILHHEAHTHVGPGSHREGRGEGAWRRPG